LKRLRGSASFASMGLTPQPRDESGHETETIRESHQRILPAWQVWLRALATDAEAALGAALAYESLDAKGREAFLDALEQDAARLAVPRVALFAPLLSVEKEPERRERIQHALGDDFGSAQRRRPRSLIGMDADGERIVVVVAPMYLDFVRLISCRFSRANGFTWIRNDPLVHADDAPAAGTRVDGVALEVAPLPAVIDEIAMAVVAQRDAEGNLPPALEPLLELFDARLRAMGEHDPSGK
jgi:hypothetical protein